MSAGRILVIEDDRDIRESLCEILEIEGYEVACAGDGREGLEVLRRLGPPCLVLLDLMMPVMNGWEFLEATRNDERLAKCPVLVVSAHVDKASTVPAAAAFVAKPVNLSRLLQLVHEHSAT